MRISILPSALIDLVKVQFFYESIEDGLGLRFREHIILEIDKLVDTAGMDEIHFGYYRAVDRRFHQNIYYKIDSDVVTVWRILDQRFNSRRVRDALLHT